MCQDFEEVGVIHRHIIFDKIGPKTFRYGPRKNKKKTLCQYLYLLHAIARLKIGPLEKTKEAQDILPQS